MFDLKKILFTLLTTTMALSFAKAQLDMENMEELKKFKMSGGLNATTTFNHVDGMESQRDPYFWMVQANLTFNLGPISAPFSASFSTQTKNFTSPKPFNHFGISPKYRSVTGHFGYRSLNFSEFTLGGVQFLGAGIEYDPEHSPMQVRAFYGRLQKAGVSRSYTGTPLYERWGYGLKTSYAGEKNLYEIIFLKATDQITSLPDTISTKNEISPADNLVIGATVSQEIMEKIHINVEYAVSAYTSDIRMPEIVLEKYTYINNFGNLFQPRASSRVNSAFLGNITYELEKVNLNFAYRRVAPDYVTLGSPYLTNDFEDLTAGVSIQLFQKLNLNVGGGVQRNDLLNERLNQTKRVIGNVAASFQASERLNLNGSLANFSSSTQMAEFVQSSTGFDPDTIFFSQVNTNGSLSANYQIPGKKTQKNLMLSASYQETSDSNENQTRFYNLTSGFVWSHTASGVVLNAGINANNNIIVGGRTNSLGPTLTISKGFFKNKVKGSLNLVHLQNQMNSEKSGQMQSARLNISWPLAKKQSLNFSSSWSNRKSYAQEQNREFNEFRGSLNYRIGF